ncbi:MAG: family 78 glycoside hydrolase catalytic domain [Planctomycetota bacterium]
MSHLNKTDRFRLGSALASASWIWIPQRDAKPHQYVCFQKAFRLDRLPRTATLDISADSDFIVCLNGAEMGRGQFSDFPTRKTFTRLHASRALRRGTNLIAVLAYCRGEDFSEYLAGRPGLIAALTAGTRLIVTDDSWHARIHPAFRRGPMPRVTAQQGFVVGFDARKDMAWPSSARGQAWEKARVLASATGGFWKELLSRPVPPLSVLPPQPVRLVALGDFFRRKRDGTFAEIIQGDALLVRHPREVLQAWPPIRDSSHYTPFVRSPADGLRTPDKTRAILMPPEKGSDGRFLILDLGRETAGLLHLDLEAPAGAVLDIAHGEHLDDGRVRAKIHNRNFADRYVCRAGLNRFTLPFRRLGARYIEVHFSRYSRPIRINYIGLRPTELKTPATGRFETHDPLANRMWATGRRTLHLCMHEHFEDCPWREQSLYAGDGRIEALCAYYAFGDYAFAAASLELLGRCSREDGLLELVAPGRPASGITIPFFTLAWMVACAEHWLYSGRPTLFRTFAIQMRRMVERMLARQDPAGGLCRVPNGKEMWHLYEWMDGLAGSNSEALGRWLHAPFNLYLHEALGHYAWMLEQSGSSDEARTIRLRRQSLGRAIAAAFWNEKKRALATYRKGNRQIHFADHTQVLALHAGILSHAQTRGCLDNLYARRLLPVTFSPMLHLIMALMERGTGARRFVSEEIARRWEPMLYAGATSFWETPLGGDDFDRAGSLCHGWSAVPIYYYQARVLGIRPLAPGFKRFVINPYPDRFFSASGAVPTPAGPISVEWRRNDRGIILEAKGPKRLQPVLTSLPEAPVIRGYYNGKPIAPSSSFHSGVGC